MGELRYAGDELDLFARASNWKGYFSDLLRPHVRGNVLEVGAGIGATMEALWNPGVSHWLCVEPDATLARQLDARIEKLSPRSIESRVGTLDDLSPAERFDCILYIDVLEHIRDDREELRHASRFLNEGGCLVVLSPAFQWLFSPFDHALGHERRYTARSLAAVFPAELKQQRLFYADSVGAFLSAGNKLLLRKTRPTLRQILFWDRAVIPVSRFVDPVARRWFGRSVIAVYSRRANAQSPGNEDAN